MKAFPLVLILLVASCGVGNTLRGSISEDLDVDFDQVYLARNGDFLEVQYLKSSTNEIVCHLIINVVGLDTVHLRGEDVVERVTLDRTTLSDQPFPGLRQDDGLVDLFHFDLSRPGSASGEFWMLFVTGRTLSGTFDGDYGTNR